MESAHTRSSGEALFFALARPTARGLKRWNLTADRLNVAEGRTHPRDAHRRDVDGRRVAAHRERARGRRLSRPHAGGPRSRLTPHGSRARWTPPGFPQTLLYAELEAKQTASLRRRTSPRISTSRARGRRRRRRRDELAAPAPLRRASRGRRSCRSRARVCAFRIAYVLGREAAPSWR